MISIICAVRGAKSAMLFRACGRENILRVTMDILTQIENYQPYNEQEERDLPLLRQALFVSFYFRIESSSRASASCR